MEPRTRVGLVGVFGIWLTAGLALPFVNVLKDFSPAQLMTFRGFLTAAMALIGLRGVVGKADMYTYAIAVVMPLATLGLFEGIRHWGAGPTIVVITATPLVNFLISVSSGRRVSSTSLSALFLMLGGVVLARWGGEFQWEGFLWSVFGTIANGVLYELFARAKSVPLQKCFWACVGMGTLGLGLSFYAGTSWSAVKEDGNILWLFGFAFVGGFLYWLANMVAFENLEKDEASVLAQGETPAVILGAFLLLGEHLTLVQGVGVGAALFGAWYLTSSLSRK